MPKTQGVLRRPSSDSYHSSTSGEQTIFQIFYRPARLIGKRSLTPTSSCPEAAHEAATQPQQLRDPLLGANPPVQKHCSKWWGPMQVDAAPAPAARPSEPHQTVWFRSRTALLSTAESPPAECCRLQRRARACEGYWNQMSGALPAFLGTFLWSAGSESWAAFRPGEGKPLDWC